MKRLRNALEKILGFLGLMALILGIVAGGLWFLYQDTERQLGAIATCIISLTLGCAYTMYSGKEET